MPEGSRVFTADERTLSGEMGSTRRIEDTRGAIPIAETTATIVVRLRDEIVLNINRTSRHPASLDEPNRLAPFVGLRTAFTDGFRGRLSYQLIDNARATAQFGYSPGNPPSLLPIVVWGRAGGAEG